MQLGQTRANLTARQVSTTMAAIADAMTDVAPTARTCFMDRAPEIGTRMLSARKDGIQESLGLTRTIVSTPESEVT
jgi:hypothetical protein